QCDHPFRARRRRDGGDGRPAAAHRPHDGDDPAGQAAPRGPDMNISEGCSRRPVMTTLIMLSFVIFGTFSSRQRAVAALPNIDSPPISAYATLPGASPETMASSVAAPLERQFAT